MNHTSRPWLLLPVRSLASGKSRLCAALSDHGRRQLNEEMLEHMLQIAAVWPGLEHTVIVSGSEEVLHLSRSSGALALRQPPCVGLSEALSETLNAGLTHAVRVLREQDRDARDIMVVSCDLPIAEPSDLRAMQTHSIGLAGRSSFVIATDRHGEGTNALWIPAGAPVVFQFGPGSRSRHVAMAHSRGWAALQVKITGLALDIDTPEDHAEWKATQSDAAYPN